MVTLLGCPTLADVEKSYRLINKILEKLHQPHNITQYSIYQVLATGYFPWTLDLERLAGLIPGAHYNPEIFPGLQFRNKEKTLRFYMTIMSNGSFVVGGLSGEQLIRRAIQLVIDRVSSCAYAQ